jgi:hypothetical protein
MGDVPINPETRVAELLEAYPELEEELIRAAAVFSKLRNPVLRRTIARVTTLERAAEIAGIPVRQLVLRLRRSAGLADGDDLDTSGGNDRRDDDERPAPWVDAARVMWTIDADQLLASEKQPIAEVERRVATLTGDQLGLIRASFRPAPLIELLEGQGRRVAVVRSDDRYAVFVAREPEADGEP